MLSGDASYKDLELTDDDFHAIALHEELCADVSHLDLAGCLAGHGAGHTASWLVTCQGSKHGLVHLPCKFICHGYKPVVPPRLHIPVLYGDGVLNISKLRGREVGTIKISWASR